MTANLGHKKRRNAVSFTRGSRRRFVYENQTQHHETFSSPCRIYHRILIIGTLLITRIINNQNLLNNQNPITRSDTNQMTDWDQADQKSRRNVLPIRETYNSKALSSMKEFRSKNAILSAVRKQMSANRRENERQKKKKRL